MSVVDDIREIVTDTELDCSTEDEKAAYLLKKLFEYMDTNLTTAKEEEVFNYTVMNILVEKKAMSEEWNRIGDVISNAFILYYTALIQQLLKKGPDSI